MRYDNWEILGDNNDSKNLVIWDEMGSEHVWKWKMILDWEYAATGSTNLMLDEKYRFKSRL